MCQNRGMRFRLGLVIGGAVGYVLGARAGRERYEDIKRWLSQVRGHPAIDQLAGQAQGVMDAGRTLLAEGLDAGSDAIRRHS
jgi:hypothetical protein